MIDLLRERVRKSPLTYDQIAAGAAVGRSWLDKFMQDRFEDYGIRRLERLRNYLDIEEARAARSKSSGVDRRAA